MNKAKYVEKMTDLVEDTLLEMNVSPLFTIEDGWEEDEELSMRLYHDTNGHEVVFNLSELYEQKREEDIKVKDQYTAHIKSRVTAFVEAEKALNLDPEEYEENEEYEEDYDDYEEEEEYEDDEEYEEDDEYEEEEEDEEYDDFDDEEEEEPLEEKDISDLARQQSLVRMGSVISGVMKNLRFDSIDGNESAMSAELPSGFAGNLEKVMKKYGSQISELFEDGAFVIRPNKKDIIVFDASVFDKEDVKDILEELYEQDGEKHIEEVEAEKEKDR